MSAQRVLTLFLLLLALVVAGCGGDDDDGGSDDGGAPVAVGTADDPATVLPAGAPVAISVATNIDSEQVQNALAFAERVEPSDRDLSAELLASLQSDEVSFEKDIKPWLGETGMMVIDGVDDDGDITGVLAAKTTDEAAAQATLDKAADDAQSATYKGIEYAVEDDGSASGIVEGFVVGASDETRFKAAVDAAQGDSLADDANYKDTIALTDDGALAFAYMNADGLIELLEQSGEIPEGAIDPSTIPGYEPGQSLVASVSAESDKVTIETASTAEAPDTDNPELAELPGDAWLAIAAAVPGDQVAAGFEQGLTESGAPPEATAMLEQLGLQRFLEGLESISMRFGGDSVANINGALTIAGSDQDAASNLLQQAASFAEQAGQGQVQIDVQGDTVEAVVGPYRAQLSAEDGDLKLTLGDQPDGELGDDEAFQTAEDELDLDDGRIAGFVDFAGLEKLLSSLPQDPDLAEGLAVIKELGVFVIGTGTEDDATTARAVLTLR